MVIITEEEFGESSMKLFLAKFLKALNRKAWEETVWERWLLIIIPLFAIVIASYSVGIAKVQLKTSIDTFNENQAIQNENEIEHRKMLAESLMGETNLNLHLVKGFANVKNQTVQNNEVWAHRFSTIIIEEAMKDPEFGNENAGIIDFDGNRRITKIKFLLGDLHTTIILTNHLLDNLYNSESKTLDIEKISGQIDIIEYDLNSLKYFLTDSYNITIENIYEN